MAAKLPDGATLEISTASTAPVTITALSNATEAVATATNTFVAGDYVIISSGWSNLNGKVVRVKSPTGSSFVLEGIDTTSTTLYPTGSGTGTAAKITTWQQVTQIMNFATSGGEQQFATYSFLEQNYESQIPTIFSAMSMSIDIADDPSLAGYQAVKSAADSRATRALRVTMPDGSKILYYGYVSFNETPSVTKGQVMSVKSSFALQARPVRYAT